MIKVLFISAWYPNRYDEMAGLFVRKHAEAVSLFANVEVLYIYADYKITEIEISTNHIGKIKETTVYFPVSEGGIISKLKKQLNYLIAYNVGWKEVTKNGFTPHILHANILTRTGLMALIIKLFTGIPYIVTEHWSRYLAIRNSYHGFLRKRITEIVVKQAQAILPVSESLKNAMLNHNLINKNYIVVNNTVDSVFFETNKLEKRNKKRILHVSCFDELAKNIKGILNVTKLLSEQRNDFELILIGTGINFSEIEMYAKNLNFPDNLIQFCGEKTPQEVASYMHNSDFFLLFSNYENSPVVIAESLICGKPVISSNVGGISEHVNESNGILVPAKDERALFNSINYMLDHFQDYDAEKIKAEARDKFSMESVGRIVTDCYRKILNNEK